MSKFNQAKLVLASASPRRQELLRGIGLEFEIIASSLDETFNPEDDPVSVACRLSLAKANDVAKIIQERGENAIVLGADTVVALNNLILGKPESHEDAERMLMLLSGKMHKVFTAVTLVDSLQGRQKTICEESAVYFRELSAVEARFYALTDEPMDKAGAYALQGAASVFIPRIEGCYTNIIGLPVSLAAGILREFGFSVMGRGAET